MQIGAINSINFKANPAACPVCEDETGIFANGDFKGEEAIDTIDKFQKTIVDSDDIKGPAAIVTVTEVRYPLVCSFPLSPTQRCSMNR